MKIAITGSFCTGKTTLAQQLKEYMGIELIPEVARLAFESGLKLDHDATADTEIWMLCKQLELEMKNESFIADRSFMDMMAYIHVLLQGDENCRLLSKLVGNILDHRLTEYDIIFYTPIEFSIHDDGIRSTDEKLRRTIDREIIQLFKAFRIKPHTLTGNAQERFTQAKEIVLIHQQAHES